MFAVSRVRAMPVLLVIDDDPLILECFDLTFGDSDTVLLTASSAAEGLAKFSASDRMRSFWTSGCPT